MCQRRLTVQSDRLELLIRGIILTELSLRPIFRSSALKGLPSC
jgi:hypothetical protein